MPLILGTLVLVLVVVVLALSFTILGSADDPEETRTVSVATTEPPEVSTTTPPNSESSPASASSEPTPPVTEPPATQPTTRPPATAAPPFVASSDELVGTLDSYITALDIGDIDLAYSYIAVSLREQEGWDYDTFSTFWSESVSGAAVVSVDRVLTSRGDVTATIDYALPDGTTSHEQVVMSFSSAGDAGFLVLVDYEVLDTERID